MDALIKETIAERNFEINTIQNTYALNNNTVIQNNNDLNNNSAKADYSINIYLISLLLLSTSNPYPSTSSVGSGFGSKQSSTSE